MGAPQTTAGISTSVPESWFPAILAPFESQTVFNHAGIVNRDYEGQIKQMGDTVHVTSLSDITVKPYNASTAMDAAEDVTTTGTSLVIDQGDYFNFKVNSVDQFQSAVNLKDPSIARASAKLVKAADVHTGTTMAAGVQSSSKLGAVEILKRGDDAYDLIVELRKKLAANDAPDNRFLIVGPEFESALLRDDRLIKANEAGTDTGLRNGFIGRMLGFSIYVTNNVKVVAGRETVLAGLPEATTYASQLTEMRQMPMEDYFATKIDGLHIYGTKVFRPEGLASAEITLADPVDPDTAG